MDLNFPIGSIEIDRIPVERGDLRALARGKQHYSVRIGPF